jgi:hypothetical protein
MGLSGFSFIFFVYQVIASLAEAKVAKGIFSLMLMIISLLCVVFLALTPDF